MSANPRFIGDAYELTFQDHYESLRGSDFGRSFLLLLRCTPHPKVLVRDSQCVFRVNKQGQRIMKTKTLIELSIHGLMSLTLLLCSALSAYAQTVAPSW